MDNNSNLSVSKLGRAAKVTTFSKYLALALFVVMPFIGGYIGFLYGQASVAEVMSIETGLSMPVSPETQSPAVTTEVILEDTTDFYTIKAVYPSESKDSAGLMAEYVKALVATKQAEWKIGGDVQKAEAKASIDFPDRPKIVYELDVRYSSTSSLKLGTVSYSFMISEMAGGASGNVAVTTFSFNKNGVVPIDSILDYENNKDIALTRLLATLAVTQNPDVFQNSDQLQQGLGLAYLKSDGVTFDAAACGCDGFFFPSNFQNFSITDTGLTFTFSKYAIAPGAMMTPDISVTWVELAPYLTTEFANNLSLD